MSGSNFGFGDLNPELNIGSSGPFAGSVSGIDPGSSLGQVQGAAGPAYPNSYGYNNYGSTNPGANTGGMDWNAVATALKQLQTAGQQQQGTPPEMPKAQVGTASSGTAQGSATAALGLQKYLMGLRNQYLQSAIGAPGSAKPIAQPITAGLLGL